MNLRIDEVQRSWWWVSSPRPWLKAARSVCRAIPCNWLWKATRAAEGKDVRVGGGIGTAREFLLAGLVDHLHVMVAPIILGHGTRLWDDLAGLELTHAVTTEVAESGTIHVVFDRKQA